MQMYVFTIWRRRLQVVGKLALAMVEKLANTSKSIYFRIYVRKRTYIH